jgi:hypothetical protein
LHRVDAGLPVLETSRLCFFTSSFFFSFRSNLVLGQFPELISYSNLPLLSSDTAKEKALFAREGGDAFIKESRKSEEKARKVGKDLVNPAENGLVSKDEGNASINESKKRKKFHKFREEPHRCVLL